MTFIINQHSTSPILYYPLTTKVMERYNITEDMLDDVAVSFSMIDQNTNFYRIANVGAEFIVNDDITRKYNGSKYVLAYQFTVKDTRKSGVFLGEFKLDFMNWDKSCSKITLPQSDKIDIIIKDSITFTEVR